MPNCSEPLACRSGCGACCIAPSITSPLPGMPQGKPAGVPCINLDAELRVQMRVELSKLHADLGTTMIYVTHDQVEAMTMADRIVVLNRGNIEQVGSPLDLYNNPDSLFVAGFIGSPKMNFVTGAEAEKHKAKTIGIRPEHLEIASGRGGWGGTIALAEHLGADSFLHVDTETAGRLVVRAPGDFRGKDGDKIVLKPGRTSLGARSSATAHGPSWPWTPAASITR